MDDKKLSEIEKILSWMNDFTSTSNIVILICVFSLLAHTRLEVSPLWGLFLLIWFVFSIVWPFVLGSKISKIIK